MATTELSVIALPGAPQTFSPRSAPAVPTARVVPRTAPGQTPYTLVLRDLKNVLLAYPDFVLLADEHNVITFTGYDRSPTEDNVTEADLPEVRILLAGSIPGQHAASNMSGDTVTYEIQVSTGDQRLDALHLPLKWVVFRALRQCESRLQLLEWNGKPFVLSAAAISVSEGVANADLNRSIIGWSAIWACEVRMYFTTLDL